MKEAPTSAEVSAHVTQYDDAPVQKDIALLAFHVASNGSMAKYDLSDQAITTFEDDTGIDASASTNEIRDTSSKYWSGGQWTNVTFSATGSDQSWTVPSGVTKAIFKCWGSSSQSSPTGSSGDANEGGYSVGTLSTTAADVYRIIVGNASGYGGGHQGYGHHWSGGLAGVFTGTGTWSATSTTDQGHAVIIAGGAGAESYNVTHGSGHQKGGPGGGTTGGDGGFPSGYLVAATGGTQSGPGTGSTGSGGSSPYTPNVMEGGEVHNTFYSGNARGGAGGAGYYGGGGGSQYSSIASGGAGGSGFVHSSMTDAQTYPYGSASDRFEGGTGNADLAWTDSDRPSGVGQNGNAGAVVVKYQLFNDMTLVSTASTADSVPTKGDLVMTISSGVGTTSIGDGTNGDIRAFISRDGGTTYTQVTLTDQGTSGGHKVLAAHDVDISSQPSGTSMRYKITTHNQGSTLETRIQAVSLGWS